jgi:hypothetical protein
MLGDALITMSPFPEHSHLQNIPLVFATLTWPSTVEMQYRLSSEQCTFTIPGDTNSGAVWSTGDECDNAEQCKTCNISDISLPKMPEHCVIA